MNTIMVLIHSPLVGPFTWALAADWLRARGIPALIPALISDPRAPRPYWKQHALAVVEALNGLSEDQPVILVAHSGAGPLLPAIRAAVRQTVAAYLFVDAGWPEAGKSRLDLFEDAEMSAQFRASAQDGLLPIWSDDDLRPVIPDDTLRRRFVEELTPLPLEVYEEPLPGFPGWPDAPCAYLRFGDNPAYDGSYARARQMGFPTLRLEGGHFHMLVDPDSVVDALITLAKKALGE